MKTLGSGGWNRWHSVRVNAIKGEEKIFFIPSDISSGFQVLSDSLALFWLHHPALSSEKQCFFWKSASNWHRIETENINSDMARMYQNSWCGYTQQQQSSQLNKFHSPDQGHRDPKAKTWHEAVKQENKSLSYASWPLPRLARRLCRCGKVEKASMPGSLYIGRGRE